MYWIWDPPTHTHILLPKPYFFFWALSNGPLVQTLPPNNFRAQACHLVISASFFPSESPLQGKEQQGLFVFCFLFYLQPLAHCVTLGR